MSRQILDGRIAVQLDSADSEAKYALGETVTADSGVYVYGQANGAIAEGYLAKAVVGTWDFDTVTTTESGTAETTLGVCVADGGLADDEYGWFWRGQGYEEVYLTASISANTQLTTHSVAGQVSTGGDNIFALFNTDASTTAGLYTCRSDRFLATNTTIAAS